MSESSLVHMFVPVYPLQALRSQGQRYEAGSQTAATSYQYLHTRMKKTPCEYNVYVWRKQKIIKLTKHRVQEITIGAKSVVGMVRLQTDCLQQTILLQKNVTSQINVPLGRRTYAPCCLCVRSASLFHLFPLLKVLFCLLGEQYVSDRQGEKP